MSKRGETGIGRPPFIAERQGSAFLPGSKSALEPSGHQAHDSEYRESGGFMFVASANRTRSLGLGLSMLGLLFIAGCSVFGDDKDTATAAPPPPPPYMPVEFAMPANSSIDRGATTVVGDNLNWYGTLTLTSDTEMDDAHQFYANELPREGWEPISALVSTHVVLQFINRHQGRAGIITILPRTVGGTRIEVTVAPLIGSHTETADTGLPRPRPDH
jgi:hypothetical protein